MFNIQNIQNTVSSNYTQVKCDNCGKRFKNNLGYGLHKLTSKKINTGSNSANVMKPTSITKNAELIESNFCFLQMPRFRRKVTI